jgi:hypothetical protein
MIAIALSGVWAAKHHASSVMMFMIIMPTHQAESISAAAVQRWLQLP